MDYTEIRDEKIRGKICELMSEMLDNPDENGIYPTSRFMWKMETYILEQITEKDAEIERLQPFTPTSNPDLDAMYCLDTNRCKKQDRLLKIAVEALESIIENRALEFLTAQDKCECDYEANAVPCIPCDLNTIYETSKKALSEIKGE